MSSASAIYSNEMLLIKAEGFLSKIPILNNFGTTPILFLFIKFHKKNNPFSSISPFLTILIIISSSAALDGAQTINLFL